VVLASPGVPAAAGEEEAAGGLLAAAAGAGAAGGALHLLRAREDPDRPAPGGDQVGGERLFISLHIRYVFVTNTLVES